MVLVLASALCLPAAHAEEHVATHDGSSEIGMSQRLLTPTADSAPGLILGTRVWSLPLAVGTRLVAPLGDHVTVLGDVALAGLPPGGGASAAVRLHILRSGPESWGLAAQVQSMAGAYYRGGEGRGGVAHALTVVVSSPMRAVRVHLGSALHTMPGSEFDEGALQAREYDLANPQVAAFLAAEYSWQHLGVFTELLWGGIGADEGWDSAFAALVGGKMRLGRSELVIGVGVLVNRFGSGQETYLPVPPIAMHTIAF
jgi:hypothetical protein